MTLREKILKTFVVTIREINSHGGPETFFKNYPVGGLYYGEAPAYRDNQGKYMGSQLDYETLNVCKKYSQNKLLVCADHTVMFDQKVMVENQSSLGASRDLEDAYNWGKIIGMQMNDKGVDWVLGPSIDMCFDPMMYLMAISDNPKVIASIYREVVRGIQDQGVCATVKHFPGLGTYFVNMHIAPGSNILPFDEWMETYGYTYKEMFKENVMSVMTTHVSLKSYDSEGENGYYPIATFSSKLTTELLKRELGFEGAVVTDAMIMGGNGTGDFVKECVQAFKAGADLLLWPPVEAAEEIEKQILNGEIPMSRLEDALNRIEKMEIFRGNALKNKTYDVPDAKFVDKTKLEIAKHGMCLLRNEIGLLPLTEKYKKVLIVDVTDEDECSAKLLKKEFEKRDIKADVCRDIEEKFSLVCWPEDMQKMSKDYDLVIFNVNAFFASQWSQAHMLIWASHQFDKKKKLVVNYGSPYFATEYFPEDPTYIEMNTTPTEDTVKMLVDGILGEMIFTGKSVFTKEKNHVSV
ncbi:MAG: glycoside hydrolase family 3 protein [Clostridia bacterium]|nr:glycoside hydrolase family 3 protein [Clostridia bacterium]